MKARLALGLGLLIVLGLVGFDSFFASPQSLQQQNEILFQQVQRVHGLDNSTSNDDAPDARGSPR